MSRVIFFFFHFSLSVLLNIRVVFHAVDILSSQNSKVNILYNVIINDPKTLFHAQPVGHRVKHIFKSEVSLQPSRKDPTTFKLRLWENCHSHVTYGLTHTPGYTHSFDFSHHFSYWVSVSIHLFKLLSGKNLILIIFIFYCILQVIYGNRVQ